MIVKPNYASIKMMLVNDANEPVSIGDKFPTRDGDEYELLDARPPHKPSSSGRVYVGTEDDRHSREFFPNVIGCRWIPAGETAHCEHDGGDR